MQAIAKADGEQETWDGSYTRRPRNQVKAQNNSGFPAFVAAANYKAQVNGKRWFLPGAGDWDKALKYFGIADAAQGYKKSRQQKHAWPSGLGYQLAEILFYQADGDAFNDWYWTANAWNSANAAAISVLIYDNTNPEKVHFGAAEKNNTAQVRAFIKY